MAPPGSVAVDDKGYRHKKIGGVVYPPFTDQAIIDDMQNNFQLREGDIVISTFPKCGTTWMQQIVLTLLFAGDKSKVPQPMVQAPWLEWVTGFKALGLNIDHNGDSMSRSELEAWDGNSSAGEGPAGRRVFKSHACAQLCPWIGGPAAFDGKRKAIVVGRNPKDTCCSLFHHTKDNSQAFQYEGDFDHFVRRLFLQGDVESGCFWKWYAGWEREAAQNPNILFITFEEMKADPVTSVCRIADFIEVSKDDDIVRNVVGASAFEAMKKKFEENDIARQASGKSVKPNHLRKGGVGSWRSEIQGDLLKAFDEAHAKKMEETGSKIEWDFGEDAEADADASAKAEAA